MLSVFRFPPLMPVTKKLLIALSATFVTAILLTRLAGLPAVELLALLPGVGVQTAWQIFTYPFVGVPSSSGVFGQLVSLVFLWMMLSPYEARFGGKAALQLTIVTALAASLVFVPAALVLPAQPMFGPGAILLGVIGALSASIPMDARVSLFGVLPMTSRVLLIGVVVLSVLMNIADANFAGIPADLAAIGAGVLFHRWWLHRPVRPKRTKPQKPRRRAHGFKVIEGGGDDERPRYLN